MKKNKTNKLNLNNENYNLIASTKNKNVKKIN